MNVNLVSFEFAQDNLSSPFRESYLTKASCLLSYPKYRYQRASILTVGDLNRSLIRTTGPEYIICIQCIQPFCVNFFIYFSLYFLKKCSHRIIVVGNRVRRRFDAWPMSRYSVARPHTRAQQLKLFLENYVFLETTSSHTAGHEYYSLLFTVWVKSRIFIIFFCCCW